MIYNKLIYFFFKRVQMFLYFKRNNNLLNEMDTFF